MKRKIDREKVLAYVKDHPEKTIAEVANDLKISVPTIYKILKEKGIKKRKVEPAEMIAYIKDHPEATIEEVANNLKISVSTIYRILKEKGIKKPKAKPKARKRKIDPEQVLAYVKDHPEKTIVEVANDLKISDSTIFRILKEKGIKKAKAKSQTRKHKVDSAEVIAYIKEHPEIAIREIANDLKVSGSTIRRILKEKGIKKPKVKSKARKRKVDPEQVLAYVKDHPEKTIAEVAMNLKVSVPTIYKILKENQIKRQRPNLNQVKNKEKTTVDIEIAGISDFELFKVILNKGVIPKEMQSSNVTQRLFQLADTVRTKATNAVIVGDLQYRRLAIIIQHIAHLDPETIAIAEELVQNKNEIMGITDGITVKELVNGYNKKSKAMDEKSKDLKQIDILLAIQRLKTMGKESTIAKGLQYQPEGMRRIIDSMEESYLQLTEYDRISESIER